MSESPSSPNPPPESGEENDLALTDEQQMLVELRDVLYEGSWADFRADLSARRQARPHVFDTIPDSPRTQSIIDDHLRIIDELEAWEIRHGRRLKGSV